MEILLKKVIEPISQLVKRITSSYLFFRFIYFLSPIMEVIGIVMVGAGYIIYFNLFNLQDLLGFTEAGFLALLIFSVTLGIVFIVNGIMLLQKAREMQKKYKKIRL